VLRTVIIIHHTGLITTSVPPKGNIVPLVQGRLSRENQVARQRSKGGGAGTLASISHQLGLMPKNTQLAL